MVNYETIDTHKIMFWLYRQNIAIAPVSRWGKLMQFLKGRKCGN